MPTSSRREATNQCAAKTTVMQMLHVSQYNLPNVLRLRIAQSIGAASNNSVECLAERTNALTGT